MKNVEYSDLKRSEKFTPALYQEKDGVWEGGSVSQFTPVMTFRLWERFSETCLEVSESMEVNGKKTFGYEVPDTSSVGSIDAETVALARSIK